MSGPARKRRTVDLVLQSLTVPQEGPIDLLARQNRPQEDTPRVPPKVYRGGFGVPQSLPEVEMRERRVVEQPIERQGRTTGGSAVEEEPVCEEGDGEGDADRAQRTADCVADQRDCPYSSGPSGGSHS